MHQQMLGLLAAGHHAAYAAQSACHTTRARSPSPHAGADKCEADDDFGIDGFHDIS
jgi:hypothetical protein